MPASSPSEVSRISAFSPAAPPSARTSGPASPPSPGRRPPFAGVDDEDGVGAVVRSGERRVQLELIDVHPGAWRLPARARRPAPRRRPPAPRASRVPRSGRNQPSPLADFVAQLTETAHLRLGGAGVVPEPRFGALASSAAISCSTWPSQRRTPSRSRRWRMLSRSNFIRWWPSLHLLRIREVALWADPGPIGGFSRLDSGPNSQGFTDPSGERFR